MIYGVFPISVVGIASCQTTMCEREGNGERERKREIDRDRERE